MGKRRRSNPNRRRRIGERDGWVCWICRFSVDPSLTNPHPHRASLDHIIEKQDGDGSGDDNLRLAHAACNTLRREWTQPKLVALIDEVLELTSHAAPTEDP